MSTMQLPFRSRCSGQRWQVKQGSKFIGTSKADFDALIGGSSSQKPRQVVPPRRQGTQQRTTQEFLPGDNLPPPPYVAVEAQDQSTPGPNRSDQGPATGIGSPPPSSNTEQKLGLDKSGSKREETSGCALGGPRPAHIEETGPFTPKTKSDTSSPPPPNRPPEDEPPLSTNRESVSDTESTSTSIPSTSDSRNATEQWIYDPDSDSLIHRWRAKELEERQRELTNPVNPALTLDKPKYVFTALEV